MGFGISLPNNSPTNINHLGMYGYRALKKDGRGYLGQAYIIVFLDKTNDP
jgi:hypothetical protein